MASWAKLVHGKVRFATKKYMDLGTERPGNVGSQQFEWDFAWYFPHSFVFTLIVTSFYLIHDVSDVSHVSTETTMRKEFEKVTNSAAHQVSN